VRVSRALAVLALTGVASFSAAQSAEWRTVYQEIAGRACSDTNPRPARPRGDHEATRRICPAYLGFKVVIEEFPNRHELRITQQAQAGKSATLGFLSGLGPRIEWLGPARGATIMPRALIVRIGAADIGDEKSSLLAVMKVASQEACLVGVLDVRTNPDANEVARREAKKRAESFRCDSDPIDVLGERSELAEAFVDRLR